MKETPSTGSVFEVMEGFYMLSLEASFTANEGSLFQALVHAWNRARRPEVLGQWAMVTATNSGLSERMMVTARKNLVSRGVIFHEKTGNRGLPKYSFNAILSKPNPFEASNDGALSNDPSNALPAGGASKSEGRNVSSLSVEEEVGCDSYQGQDQGDGQENDSPPPPSVRERPSLELAKAAALQNGLSKEQASDWHDAREASGWTRSTANGGSVEVGANWQADMRSYAKNRRAGEFQKTSSNRPNGQPNSRLPIDPLEKAPGYDF